MDNINIFEIATRNKYRFNYKGTIGVEDLWDLNVTALDTIFKGLKMQEKENQEESLLHTKTKEDVELETKIAIVRRIVEVKQQEVANKKAAKEKAEQKKKIMAVLAEKQDAALYEKSEAELAAMLAEME